MVLETRPRPRTHHSGTQARSCALQSRAVASMATVDPDATLTTSQTNPQTLRAVRPACRGAPPVPAGLSGRFVRLGIGFDWQDSERRKGAPKSPQSPVSHLILKPFTVEKPTSDASDRSLLDTDDSCTAPRCQRVASPMIDEAAFAFCGANAFALS